MFGVRNEAQEASLPDEWSKLPSRRIRDAAIVLLEDGDAPLAARLQSELSEFLAFAVEPARAEA